MSKQLGLDRDFTRFLNDPTFPYKVTVCIGGERILCSGVLLSQQSSVLEKKMREADGVLMFEEMLDVENSNTVISDCINYLHGADLLFTLKNIEAVLKFASWYKVNDLFEKSLFWLEAYLTKSRSANIAMDYLKVSNQLGSNESTCLKAVISKFIRSDRDIVGMDIEELLDSSFSGFDIALIVAESPANSDEILKQWASLSDENRAFIIENHSLFDFTKIFGNADEFSSFVSHISTGALSVESMKSLLDIQKDYFSYQNVRGTQESVPSKGTSNMSLNRSLTPPKPTNFCFIESNALSVIIYNVPSSATEPRLLGLFKSVGKIEKIKRQKSDKTAIMTFQDSASVSRLVNSQCNYRMDGCHLHINPYDERKSLDYNLTYVYVGNLPDSASKRQITQLFKFAGRIVSIDQLNREAAILKFEDTSSARRLLNCGREFMLDGHELELEECEESDDEEEEDDDEDDEDDREAVVYVGNVPETTSQDDLKHFFSGFGRVVSVTIKKRSNAYRYAFIKFEKNDSAIALVTSSQSKRYELKGNVLKIAKSNR